MRVLLISRCPPYPLHLGDRLIVWHLTEELARRGVQFDLLALAQRSQDHAEANAYRHLFEHVTLFDEAPRPLPTLLRRALWPAARFPQRSEQAWNPALWRTVQQFAQRPYDAIHLFGGVQVYECAAALGQRAAQAVITPYESYSLYSERVLAQDGGLVAALRLDMARRYESFMFAPYGPVVVLTEADALALRRLNPSLDVRVIPNGIDLAYFQPGSAARQPAELLFLGNYEYAPNVDAALFLIEEVLPRVRAAFPQVVLKLVGHAPPPTLLARQSEVVRVLGRVDDVRPHYAQATAFVAPLRLGAGMKNKILEALAMQTPVVTTPIGADGIALQHGEHALIASAESIAEQVTVLLRDPALGQRLGRAGRALIEARYSWGAVAEAYLKLYTE
ncbi:MAG: glycosyltransferase family 4 protein [Anaerolineae bacterium]|nr:glycosyltransferase family 4 protein [Anaerolineae bacterium]MDW8173531.1 glycosyltransferase family 4 protein [Anaerolineae bacterium]